MNKRWLYYSQSDGLLLLNWTGQITNRLEGFIPLKKSDSQVCISTLVNLSAVATAVSYNSHYDNFAGLMLDGDGYSFHRMIHAQQWTNAPYHFQGIRRSLSERVMTWIWDLFGRFMYINHISALLFNRIINVIILENRRRSGYKMVLELCAST